VPGGGPVRERAGPFSYRVKTMTRALIISSRIASIFNARARWSVVISYLRGYAGGTIPPAFPFSSRCMNNPLIRRGLTRHAIASRCPPNHQEEAMRLGITVDMGGAHPRLDIERVTEAERLGFSQAWTGEAYGTDAVTPATWMLAHTTKLMVGTGIMQIPARTPAMAAMTAMTLQHLSGGRFLCGLGVSGPQVIEG